VKRTRHKTPLQFTLNAQLSRSNLTGDHFRTASQRLENGFVGPIGSGKIDKSHEAPPPIIGLSAPSASPLDQNKAREFFCLFVSADVAPRRCNHARLMHPETKHGGDHKS
jgi:hypothetical protein